MRMNLTGRLFLIYVVTALLPTILFFVWTYLFTRNTLLAEVQHDLNTLADNRKRAISRIVERNTELVTGVVNSIELVEAASSYIRAETDADKEQLGQFFDDIVSRDTGVTALHVYLDALGKDVAIGEYHREAHEADFGSGNAANVARILQVSQEEYQSLLFAPIMDRQQRVGHIIIEKSADELIMVLMDRGDLGTTAEILMAERNADGSSHFLLPTLVSPYLPSEPRGTVPAESRLPITWALEEVEELFLDATDYRGQKVVSATRYIPEVKWGLVLKEDAEDVFRDVRVYTRTAFGMGISYFTLMSIVFYLFGRNMGMTVVRILRVVRNMTGGNLEQRIPVDGSDEFSDLSREVNGLADQLKQSYDQFDRNLRDRTDALERTKRMLEAKVAEQETITKAMTGRELRMQELKEENAQLKRRIDGGEA